MTHRPLHVYAAGTPREVGLAHGQAARDLIEANLQLYFHRFQKEWGLPREEILRRARMYEAVIWDQEPDYGDALEGVAEGSGLPLEDLIALNVRYEIVYSEHTKLGKAQRGAPPPGECTSFAVLPERAGGRLVLAQNWDWIPGIRGLVLQTRVRDGPEVLAFTEAGIVGGKIGLNEHRLGLLINGLLSNEDDWERLGTPFHVRCWRVLQSETVDEARERLEGSAGSCSANFLLAQWGGGEAVAVDVESSPVGTAELRPEEGVLTHTNHFHCEAELGIWQPLILEKTSTFDRHDRIGALMAERLGSGTFDAEAAIQLLSDHHGRPKSLCRHQEDLVDWPEEQRYETVASVVLDLDARSMLLAPGPPCETEYHRYALENGG